MNTAYIKDYFFQDNFLESCCLPMDRDKSLPKLIERIKSRSELANQTIHIHREGFPEVIFRNRPLVKYPPIGECEIPF